MIDSLIVGCGPNPHRRERTHRETMLDVRPFPGVDVIHDLNCTPWPFPDNSFAEVVAIHVVEHLRDLVQFMDEAWRVLRPGGTVYLVTPEAGADFDLTHADPTHVRCYRVHTFVNYFLPSEAAKRGYTERLWAPLHLKATGGVIYLHAAAIKPMLCSECGKPAS